MDMRIELARLHKQLQTTMVYVTHDQVEAMTMGDRIAVLNQGRIEQVGRPLDLYHRPDNLFVAGFLGTPKINVIERPSHASTAEHQKLWDLLLPQGEASGQVHSAGIRCEHLHFSPYDTGAAATVVLSEHLGDSCVVHMRVHGLDALLHARVSGDTPRLEPGAVVHVHPDPQHTLRFDAQGGRHD
jgi:multiple sugar transport system ATP-binding protein